MLKRNRLRWLGHVLRMQSDRIPRRVLFDKQPATWKRPRCRPHLSWNRVTHYETCPLQTLLETVVVPFLTGTSKAACGCRI
jgi:hypothetical protein